MVSFIKSAAVSGTGAELVSVECDMSQGMPAITVVGLPDTAVRESKERLRAAIINSGLRFPWNRRITINLSPAGTKKEGTHFDLPIALGLMICGEEIDSKKIEHMAVVGELSLDGKINPIVSALPLCIGMKEQGINDVVIPAGNLDEVSIIEGMNFYPVENIQQAYDFLMGKEAIRAVTGKRPQNIISEESKKYAEDFCDVQGQESAKRAIEISVSGFHHLLFSGPPGCGKSMMAKRIPTVMPDMSYEEMLEVTKLYSLYGKEMRKGTLVYKRPFRSPGGNVTVSALLGGGSGTPRPGEITLAHYGVLFLDEMPEYRRDVLEALRQPLEDERVTISRASGKITYPCKFILIGAKNPCPCGYYGTGTQRCTCTSLQVKRYRERISGPIMDRFDMFIDLSPSSENSGSETPLKSKSSKEMKAQIEIAREIQKERYKNINIEYNSQLTGNLLKKYCALGREERKLYEMGCESLAISRRAADKILRVARTIADMDSSDDIKTEHIAEAIRFRSRDDE